MYDDSYLELKVEFGIQPLEFEKSFHKIKFDELSSSLSYYPVQIKIIDRTDDQNDNDKTIISLNGYFYDMEYIYKYGEGIFDTFDMISGDTNKIYHILFDNEDNIKCEYQTFCDNIFYIDRVYVEKEYRNKGYAKLVLSQLEELIRYVIKLNVGIIIVCAQPFEMIDDKVKFIRNNNKLKKQLIELYKKSGFKETKSTYDYLIKIIDA